MKTREINKYRFTPVRVGGVMLLGLAIFTMLAGLDESAPASEDGDKVIEWVSFDEGANLAMSGKKKMIVDVYADWCSWCKKMDADTYTATGVKSELSKHFIPVKLNAESAKKLSFRGTEMTEQQFAQSAGISGYPSTLFLDETHTPITIVPGYITPDRFEVILRYIGENHYKSTPFQDFVARQPSNR